MVMSEADLLALVSQATEFENVKVREEELPELDRLLEECVCDVKVRVPWTIYGTPLGSKCD